MNFEKELDDFIVAMKDASIWLKEVNLQMLEIERTGKSYATKYVLYDATFGAYVIGFDVEDVLLSSKLEDAMQYANYEDAERASKSSEDELIIKKIKIKVVE